MEPKEEMRGYSSRFTEYQRQQWREMLTKLKHRCAICLRHFNKTNRLVTVDHIIPLSLGGKHSMRNIQPLCLECNRWKGRRILTNEEIWRRRQLFNRNKPMEKKICHLMMVPFTGLGLYGGFRGNRWLKNRIEVFKRFVIPSLMNQTKKEFTVWITWRPEERHNSIVQEFMKTLDGLRGMRFVHTFGGLCFWDDKYPDDKAYERLADALHYSTPYLRDVVGDADWVYLTIQPSDDLYVFNAVERIQNEDPAVGKALGFKQGYICNYSTMEVSEYNPTTNPPFYTIIFPREVFFDPKDHMAYTGPYKSHEYVPDYTKYKVLEGRGFLVGTHGENVSTYYDHPFKGQVLEKRTLLDFGIFDAEPVNLNIGWKRRILRWLPHKIRRDVRYYLGEKLYNFWRS